MNYLENSYSHIQLSPSALHHNIKVIAQHAGQSKLGIVIKANGYGHGFDELLAMTKDIDEISFYFTARLTEALHIRSKGINKPILVMSTIDADPLYACLNNISLILHDRSQYLLLKKIDKDGLIVKVHLKVDTGLSRLGFLPEELPYVLAELAQMPHVSIEGIFTHFAQAEIPDQSFTELQMDRFTKALQLIASTCKPKYVHAYASSAALTRPAEITNLCRIGAAAYGLWPSSGVKAHAKHIDLIQVLTWKTSILQIRLIPAGVPIGYGCSYIPRKPCRMALLPIGYADGYPRSLSGKSCVLIHGQLAPVIGKISMNLMSVDVSEVPRATIGSEVILTGPYEGIKIEQLASMMDSYNPREIPISIRGTREIIDEKRLFLNDSYCLANEIPLQ